jgi:hypothetical protein
MGLLFGKPAKDGSFFIIRRGVFTPSPPNF